MSESKTLSLIAVPTCICLVAGVSLAYVYGITKAPIERAKQKAKNVAIAKVLPHGDEGPLTQYIPTPDGGSNTFYVMRNGGKLIGVAVEASSPNGYNGNVSVMVGIDTAFNQVQAVEVLEQKETPGLGANVTGEKFRGQFTGLDVDNTIWKVRKDGGEIDAITAATITSRAATAAVDAAVKSYRENRQALQEMNQLGELAPIDEIKD